MEISDEYGIVAAIVEWQTSHPDLMLPAHVFGSDPTSDQAIVLVGGDDDPQLEKSTLVSVSNVPKRLLPLMVAVGLGREPSYLAELIRHHKLYFADIEQCMWQTDHSVLIVGTSQYLMETDVAIGFFQGANTCDDLKIHADFEEGNSSAAAGLLFMDEEKYWIKHKYLKADVKEKASLLEDSGNIPYKLAFAREDYWPEGSIGKLIDRAGGYLPDVLFGDELHRLQPDLEPDFWYSFFTDSIAQLSPENRVEYLRKLMSSADQNNDLLFYKGLRVLEVYSEVNDDILWQLKHIELAAGENGKRLISDLQLLKGISDPTKAKESLAEQGYTERFESPIFVHNIFVELLDVAQREVNHADLKAFSKLHFKEGTEQDLSNVDVPGVLIHVLNAYESKCNWFKKTAMISDDLVKTISYLKPHLPKDLSWAKEAGEECLQLLAMGGVQTHEMMSFPSRAAVFRYELNL